VKGILKKILIIGLMLLCFSTIASYAASIDALSVNFDSTTFDVSITGKISTGEGKQVTCKINAPNGDISYINQMTAGSDGAFDFSFKMTNIANGTYTVIVTGEAVNTPSQGTFTYQSSNPSAQISPIKASFDKKTSAQADISVQLNANGNTLTAVKKQGSDLIQGTDYTVTGASIVIKKQYLATLPKGKNTITFDMNAGDDPQLEITVSDSTQSGGGAGGGGGGSSDESKKPEQPIKPVNPKPEEPKTGLFADVNSIHWAKTFIEAMAEKGILKGMTEKTFEPEGTVTRAQFAAMLVRAFVAEKSKALITDKFKDAAADAWYAQDVMSAVEAGLVTGYEDGTFSPDKRITRQEMAVIAARAMKAFKGAVVDESFKLEFKDNSKMQDYAKEAVSLAVKNGVINGKPGNIFDPEGFSTRAEAAKIIYMIYNIK